MAALVSIAVAFAVSLVMLRNAVGVASPWFGLMIMFDVLGLIAFARPLFLLRMPSFLRKARAWETRGTLYKALRVPAFGMLLRRTPLRALNPTVYLGPQSGDPSVVLAQLESAEAAHLLAAVVIVPYIVHAWIQRWWSAVAWLVVAQIGFNVYPILHLRWARIRLKRLQERTRRGT
ncbi:MAG: glycosyl-4,4'-diaponeurosporenoate acyltransferase CrtO family protein [Usitatibacter sp.]